MTNEEGLPDLHRKSATSSPTLAAPPRFDRCASAGARLLHDDEWHRQLRLLRDASPTAAGGGGRTAWEEER